MKARARHILVTTKAQCEEIKASLVGGAGFEEMAAQYSKCPSGKAGGDLGEFGPGQMVPEFDQVVFSGSLGTIHGPVKTQFGHHLIEILARG